MFALFTWAQSARETSSLTCQMTAFMTADREAAPDKPLKFVGRGLLTCRNERGFTSELPVHIDLVADTDNSAVPAGEIALSGTSLPFVVPREVTQLQDSYQPQISNSGDDNSLKTLLRGRRHDLLIEINFSSHLTPIKGLSIISMELRLNEKTPRLSLEAPNKSIGPSEN